MTWSIPATFVPALLEQAWFLMMMVEAHDEDDVPERIRFEAGALRSMTEEYALKSPLPKSDPEQMT